jgi:hypothetical protein
MNIKFVLQLRFSIEVIFGLKYNSVRQKKKPQNWLPKISHPFL